MPQQNTEHRTQNTEHGTQNTERGTRNTEQGTQPLTATDNCSMAFISINLEHATFRRK